MKLYKTFIIAIFAVFAVAAYAGADVSGNIIHTPDTNTTGSLSMQPGSGVLHEYYIGLHSPGGDCVTKVIKAETLSEAFSEGVKSCPNCAIYDLTDNFTGKGNEAFARQSLRYCPLSETGQ